MPRKGSLTRKNRDLQTLTKDNRYVLYIRASTPEQVNSLDAQKQSGTRFAERLELDTVATFIDHGVSALKCDLRDRPQACEMFRHMRKHDIRNILVLRVDRAFRSIRDFTLTIAWAEEQGFAFRFIDPDLDLSTPSGKLFMHLQVALAQMECDIRSSRVDGALDSLRSHRLSRNGSAAPYGWQAVPCTDGTTTRQGHGQYRHLPIPAEQAVLRHLLELWELHQGHGALTRIAAIMNDLGIPTKMAGQSMTKHGRTVTCSGQWFPATVKSVLEHAVPATDAELLDGIPSLDQAIAILRQTSPTSPTRPTSSSPLVSCVLQS
jgi:predicted site-specific integrase-resolvase